jgi:excisionase family DNA binding protein
MPEKPEFLKIREVAGRLRVSRQAVDNLIKDGTLPAIRVGKVIRISSKAVDDFIDRQTARIS